MGGSSGIIGRLVGQQAQTSAPSGPYGAAYQAPRASVYAPSFQTPAAPAAQPIRGIGATQYPQLQAALNNMLTRYGQNAANLQIPTARPPQQLPPMPVYRAPQLNYRPNMAPAQQSLGRVAVSVAEQQRRAAQAEADRLRAENEALQQSYSYNPPWYETYGG
jgi:hypothetical protein